MKYIILPLAGFVLATAMFMAIPAKAQQNYVLCKSPLDGTEAVFPGTRCPSGWIYIRPVM